MIGTHPAYVHDAETLKRWCCWGVRNIADPNDVRIFASPQTEGTESFDALRAWYPTLRASALFLTFNGLAFDNWILQAILEGEDDPLELYAIGQRMIRRNNGKGRPTLCDSAMGELSIDLRAIAGAKDGQPNLGSLKELGIKLGYRYLMEMPLRHDDETLAADEVGRICVPYNKHDLAITALAAKVMEGDILSRIAMREEYGAEVLNDPDAKLAERVIGRLVFGAGKPTYTKRTHWTLNGESVVSGIGFLHPELKALRERIKGWRIEADLLREVGDDGEEVKKIVSPKFHEEVEVGGVGYTIKKGGVHSIDTPGMFEAGNGFELHNCDISGAYPAQILNHRIAPKHVPQNAFLAAYGGLRDRRIVAKSVAKQSGDAQDQAIADGLKISVNGAFGKGGSPYSWMLDPEALFTCTVRTELTLLSFVDMLATFEDCSVLSANTDGLFLKLPVADVADVRQSFDNLAEHYGLTLDWAQYQMIARRDVNNYFSIDSRGKIAGKGAYGFNVKNLRSKPVNRIAIRAMQQFFAHGTPLDETVRGSRDLLEYIDYQKVQKGHHLELDGVPLGHIARWYIGTGEGGHIDKVNDTSGKRTQEVLRGAVNVADLPAEFPADIDYEWYVARAQRLIDDVLHPVIKERTTLGLKDLSVDQRAALAIAQADSVACPVRCATIDLARAAEDYAKVIKGNRYSTMLSLLSRAWIAGRGTLRLGDLVWLGMELGWEQDKVRKMAEGVVGLVPFPIPRTIEEHVARAMTWAQENVEPLKRKRPMRHKKAWESTFITTAALEKYDKKGDVYALACAICSVGVKHAALPDAATIATIIQEVTDFLTLPGSQPHEII